MWTSRGKCVGVDGSWSVWIHSFLTLNSGNHQLLIYGLMAHEHTQTNSQQDCHGWAPWPSGLKWKQMPLGSSFHQSHGADQWGQTSLDCPYIFKHGESHAVAALTFLSAHLTPDLDIICEALPIAFGTLIYIGGCSLTDCLYKSKLNLCEIHGHKKIAYTAHKKYQAQKE